MRIIFAGTPTISQSILSFLLKSEQNIIACYTQPDRASGRGQQIEQSPVKILAAVHNIPLVQPENFKSSEAIGQLQALQADIMVVVAYGLILPPKVLAIPTYGCLNIHTSLLPRWRGASPISQAILAGDTISGISIIQMDRGMDTGDIVATQACPLDGSETTFTLTQKLAHASEQPLLELLHKLAKHETLTAHKQDNALATYAPKINKSDALINWSNSAQIIERQIRAYNPWPIAFSYFDGEAVKIWSATLISRENDTDNTPPGSIIAVNKQGIVITTGLGILQITALQFPSKKIMHAAELFNFKKLALGAVFKSNNS
jgi:methionyl-tRNA formyltransferase